MWQLNTAQIQARAAIAAHWLQSLRILGAWRDQVGQVASWLG
jgi:hypothetical protein